MASSNKERIYAPLNKKDLRRLRELALDEHEKFFERNPHLRRAYYNSLIGICLCQGAALHYLNPKIGIKDFDIWHFYLRSSWVNFPYRAHKRIENGYMGMPIDFLKRDIPRYVYDQGSKESGQVIMNYLLERNTKSKNFLLKKAIIGLYPDKIFGKVLWKGSGDIYTVT
ncbi:MAG: hypothetical protein DRP11_03840 [Candidatus Aenigmatarchaeota archaeon]|nr:MAG: hypothetical protein DRP11_03840 [Candidatus Aenigmarchaeota archaeon]